MVMARVHGHPWQERWQGAGWPPVQDEPPQVGIPSLERNHAYHCKLTPGVFLGMRCNHDLSILLRLPVVRSRVQGFLSDDGPSDHADEDDKGDSLLEQSIKDMTQLIIDHEFYASDYSTKDQPHAANLLQTLHDSLIRHDHYAAERELSGKSEDDMDRARPLLQSLICATNRRLHKGMPSILRLSTGEAKSLLFSPEVL